MTPRRVTIRDVARAAGVSTTTVSVALSGEGRLSETTRQRVREVAEATGYVASAAARNLRLGRSGALGLYVPDRTVGFEYYVHLSRGAAESALGHGFALTLVPAWDDPDALRALHLDGLIVSDPALDDPVLQTLREIPVPMVTCERDPAPGARSVGVVRSEHTQAMRALLDHLASAGAASVAVLAPGPETSFGQEIREACDRPGVRVVDVPLAYATEDVTRAMADVLGVPPDALVTVPDGAALLALQQLDTAGIRVPEDMLLASYVDAPSLLVSRPPVTAVDINPRLTGESAVNTLVDVIVRGRPGPIDVTVPAETRVRASTRR